MKPLLPLKFHYYIYVFALILLVIGLPTSKFLMSLSQIILACNWLLEGNLKNKVSKFWKNKPAVILSSVLVLHIIGLFYTSDFAYALNDIRIKAPLFILPFIISTSEPLSKKMIDLVLKFFIAAVIFGTIVSTLILTDVIHRNIVDVRHVSIFISHIRFALLICVAIFVCAYFVTNASSTAIKLIWSIIPFWFILFLIMIESLTGLSVLIATTFLLVLYKIVISKNIIIKWGGITVIVVFVIVIVNMVSVVMAEFPKKEIVDFSKLDKYTSQGNLYEHDLKGNYTENGYYIWTYYCEKELDSTWNQRSKINFSKNDLKGNPIKFTLVRYLASKGLRKDAEALLSLTDDEIKAVERGVVNVNYPDVFSLKGRIHEICWELDLYKTTGDPNGHSLTQRFEYWKTAIGIVKENSLIGVGTGDVQVAFDEQYVKTNSPLHEQWRLRSHNQYLSITVAFGIIGLLWFMLSLIYPVVKQKMVFDYLYITFFIVAIISFFTEDTLETQAGVTFYAFFNAFFLFGRSQEEQQN